MFPLFPAKTEPEGFEPGPETVNPFLSEEEVCGDASQAVCMSKQRQGLVREAAAGNSAAPAQARKAWANSRAKKQLAGGFGAWLESSGAQRGPRGLIWQI